MTEGGRLGELALAIKRDVLKETYPLCMENPIRIHIPMRERPEKITAMYLFNPWWTRPAFVESFRDIPERTQIAFFKYENKTACFLPMAGSRYKTYMNGGSEQEICLEMTAGIGGLTAVREPVYLMTEAETVAEAVKKAFRWLAKSKGIRLREERRIPEMFSYLGWCSWDAFRTEITEEKVRAKAEELREKQVPVRWILFDDGWFSAQEKMLYDFIPDPKKFPGGLRPLTEELRREGGFRWFGVWHALGGYWNGIAPNGPLAVREAPYLYRTTDGRMVPSPETGSRFYDDWYKILAREGIDFVKVDDQSSTSFYFENSLPLMEAAGGMNESLERGACRMDGAVLNCMGMAMENILSRPVSAVSRNSDDFVPEKKGGFSEHLLQNVYNAVYHNELYCCDWDMFWTSHEDAAKHSLLRAISGGPVYFSDRIGETDPEILRRLVYRDGRVLRMERSARPTEDCIFTDPVKTGVLKLHNAAAWGSDKKAGGIAVCNLTDEPQAFSFSPSDVPELDAEGEYWIFDYFAGKSCRLRGNEAHEDTLAGGGFAWYVILPLGQNGSCLGLLDKYAGFTAVEESWTSGDTDIMTVRESGTLGWLSEKTPRNVTVNGIDVAGRMRTEGTLKILALSEKEGRIVVSVVWE